MVIFLQQKQSWSPRQKFEQQEEPKDFFCEKITVYFAPPCNLQPLQNQKLSCVIFACKFRSSPCLVGVLCTQACFDCFQKSMFEAIRETCSRQI
jgi:hypothetical protein